MQVWCEQGEALGQKDLQGFFPRTVVIVVVLRHGACLRVEGKASMMTETIALGVTIGAEWSLWEVRLDGRGAVVYAARCTAAASRTDPIPVRWRPLCPHESIKPSEALGIPWQNPACWVSMFTFEHITS